MEIQKIQKGLIHTLEYTHETNLSLKGSIDEIFLRLEKTSIQLINNFLDDFPDKIKIKMEEEKYN